MAGLVQDKPGHPDYLKLRPPKRYRRDKPGDDDGEFLVDYNSGAVA
jgi:hypothetical protein